VLIPDSIDSGESLLGDLTVCAPISAQTLFDDGVPLALDTVK
jgi:hypothetical protein